MNWKVFRNKKFKIFIFVIVILFILYFVVNEGMLVLGKGYIQYFQGRPLLVLGVAKYVPEDQREPYPPEIMSSFTGEQKTADGKATYRMAKYKKNVIISRVDGNVVYGTDIATGEQDQFLWTK